MLYSRLAFRNQLQLQINISVGRALEAKTSPTIAVYQEYLIIV